MAAFDEGKETIGSFVLDAITPMINTVVNTVIPAVAGFIDSVGGKEGLTNAFKTYIDLIKNIFQPVLEGFKFAFDQIKGCCSIFTKYSDLSFLDMRLIRVICLRWQSNKGHSIRLRSSLLLNILGDIAPVNNVDPIQ